MAAVLSKESLREPADRHQSLNSDLRAVGNVNINNIVLAEKRRHRLALVLVTLVAFLTRFCGLSHPAEVIFDEVHTIKFLSWYLSGEYFFDLHPPGARLLYLAWAKFLSWQGGYLPEGCGESYITHNVPYVGLRALSAFFSSCTIPLVYLVLQESGCSVPACVVAAGFLAFDTAHIAHERTIYLDGMLCFFVVWTVFAYTRFSKERSWTRPWWQWLSLTGLGLMCTISTKMVGVFTYLLIGLFTIRELWLLFSIHSGKAVGLPILLRHVLVRMLLFLVIPFLFYLLWFYIHLAILYKSGDGDDYMSDRFILTLENNVINQTIPLSFHRRWYLLQSLMIESNKNVGQGTIHPYESRPHNWLFPSSGVFFWESNELRQQIYFLGNIPAWWLASTSVILFPMLWALDYLCDARGVTLFNTRLRKHVLPESGFFFVAYLTHYLPFWLMNRQLMMHSYLPAHIMSILLFGTLLQFVVNILTSIPKDDNIHAVVMCHGSSDDPALTTKSATINLSTTCTDTTFLAWCICWLCLLPTFLFWWFWMPLTYGQPTLSPAAVSRREIFGVRLLYSPSCFENSC